MIASIANALSGAAPPEQPPPAAEATTASQPPDGPSRSWWWRETFKGYGHNAHPVCDEGVACDACNGAIVVPERFRKWAP